MLLWRPSARCLPAVHWTQALPELPVSGALHLWVAVAVRRLLTATQAP
jgi:hypothetical protein